MPVYALVELFHEHVNLYVALLRQVKPHASSPIYEEICRNLDKILSIMAWGEINVFIHMHT